VCIQGFGNVGNAAARCFVGAGARVIAVQDVSGSIHNAKGIDIPALCRWTAPGNRVSDFKEAEVIDEAAFWRIESEFLIPAALGQQITEHNAEHINTRILIEGANGPTLPAADDILLRRAITVVPDVVANAGGVTVSYFEWVQDIASFFWSEDEINGRLDRIMNEAFAATWAIAEEKKVSLRTAAYILGCRRILDARHLRGLYP